jgi:hypothetical protein
MIGFSSWNEVGIKWCWPNRSKTKLAPATLISILAWVISNLLLFLKVRIWGLVTFHKLPPEKQPGGRLESRPIVPLAQVRMTAATINNFVASVAICCYCSCASVMGTWESTDLFTSLTTIPLYWLACQHLQSIISWQQRRFAVTILEGALDTLSHSIRQQRPRKT